MTGRQDGRARVRARRLHANRADAAGSKHRSPCCRRPPHGTFAPPGRLDPRDPAALGDSLPAPCAPTPSPPFLAACCPPVPRGCKWLTRTAGAPPGARPSECRRSLGTQPRPAAATEVGAPEDFRTAASQSSPSYRPSPLMAMDPCRFPRTHPSEPSPPLHCAPLGCHGRQGMRREQDCFWSGEVCFDDAPQAAGSSREAAGAGRGRRGSPARATSGV